LNTKLIGIGVLIGLSIVVVIFGAVKFNLFEMPIAEEEPLFDVEAWSYVTSYNGKDGQGQTILDIIKSINEEMYPDPNILLNGTSFVEWRSFKESTLGDDVYQVDFFIDTIKETHWRRKWQPTAVFLPGESQGRGSLVGCHLWGRTESDMTEVT